MSSGNFMDLLTHGNFAEEGEAEGDQVGPSNHQHHHQEEYDPSLQHQELQEHEHHHHHHPHHEQEVDQIHHEHEHDHEIPQGDADAAAELHARAEAEEAYLQAQIQQQQEQESQKVSPVILGHRSSCHTCRKRKMKCDAARPNCSTCLRSRNAGSTGQPSIIPPGDCTYDREPTFVSAPATNSKPRRKRAQKEKLGPSEREEFMTRIAELEHQLALHQQSQEQDYEHHLQHHEGDEQHHHHHQGQEELYEIPPPDDFPPAPEENTQHQHQPPAPTFSSSGLVQLANTASQQLANPATQQAFSQALSASNRRGNSANDQAGIRGHQSRQEIEPQNAPTWTHDIDDVYAEALHYNQSFDTVSVPSYSPDLPPPQVVIHLCEIFFARHPLRCMIYQPDLMASLSLPPSHPNSVPLSILHAIIAAAASLSPYAQGIESSFLKSDTFQSSEMPLPAFAGDGRSSDNLPRRAGIMFGEFHMKRARVLIEEDLLKGDSPIDSTQGLCLIVYTLWVQARFLEATALAPTLCRMTSPYGLSQLRSRHATPLASLHTLGYRPVLEPPQSAVDEHLRRMLFWQIWIIDFIVSIGSRFETTLKEEFTRTNLPSLTEEWLIGLDSSPNHQTLASSDLHTSNHLDPFNLLVKAVVLHRRSHDFLNLQDPDNTQDLEDPFKLEGFSRQDEVLFEFVASWPPHLQSLIGDDGSIHSDLWAAHSITYAAILNLHEPFASGTNLSAHREANAVKAIVKMAHLLVSTSHEISLMHICFGLGLQAAGRAICRRLSFPWPSDDQAFQEALIQDLDLIINLLSEWGQKAPAATWSARVLIRFRQRSNSTTPSSRSKAAYTGQLPIERLYKNQAKLLELGLIPDNDEEDLTKSPPPEEFDGSGFNKEKDNENLNENGKGKRKAEESVWTYPMRQKKVRKGLDDWLGESVNENENENENGNGNEIEIEKGNLVENASVGDK